MKRRGSRKRSRKLATASTVQRIEQYVNEFFYSKNYRVDPVTLKISNSSNPNLPPKGYVVSQLRGGYIFEKEDE